MTTMLRFVKNEYKRFWRRTGMDGKEICYVIAGTPKVPGQEENRQPMTAIKEKAIQLLHSGSEQYRTIPNPKKVGMRTAKHRLRSRQKHQPHAPGEWGSRSPGGYNRPEVRILYL